MCDIWSEHIYTALKGLVGPKGIPSSEPLIDQPSDSPASVPPEDARFSFDTEPSELVRRTIEEPQVEDESRDFDMIDSSSLGTATEGEHRHAEIVTLFTAAGARLGRGVAWASDISREIKEKTIVIGNVLRRRHGSSSEPGATPSKPVPPTMRGDEFLELFGGSIGRLNTPGVEEEGHASEFVDSQKGKRKRLRGKIDEVITGLLNLRKSPK